MRYITHKQEFEIYNSIKRAHRLSHKHGFFPTWCLTLSVFKTRNTILSCLELGYIESIAKGRFKWIADEPDVYMARDIISNWRYREVKRKDQY